MDFEIQRATFRDHNDLSGWAIVILVYGYSATSLDAQKSWTRGVLALSEFTNPDPLHFAHTDLTIALVIKPGVLRFECPLDRRADQRPLAILTNAGRSMYSSK